MLVASGSLVGMAAIVGILPTYVSAQLLLYALLLIFGSLGFTFIHMQGAARETAALRHASEAYLLFGVLLPKCGSLRIRRLRAL